MLEFGTSGNSKSQNMQVEQGSSQDQNLNISSLKNSNKIMILKKVAEIVWEINYFVKYDVQIAVHFCTSFKSSL